MIVSFCAACAKNTTPSTTTETTESNNTETTPAESTDTEEVPDAASLVSDAFIDPLNDWSQYDDLMPRSSRKRISHTAPSSCTKQRTF